MICEHGKIGAVGIPGLPHHVTQRGNRRQQTFFNDGDYVAYLELMAEYLWPGRPPGESRALIGDHRRLESLS